MTRLDRGLTLVEILAAIVILAVISGIVFSVYLKVAKRSKSVPCTTNLRQVGAAWALYRSSNDDRWPNVVSEFVTADSAEVFRCPVDSTPLGANVPESRAAEVKISYFYTFPVPEFRQTLYEADPGAAILYCVLHGDKAGGIQEVSNATLDTTGAVLRLSQDLSVSRTQVSHLCMEGGLRTRSAWMLMSDAPCPEPFCPEGSYPCH